MRLRFQKMQGAGNDFVLLNKLGSSSALSSEMVRKICDRHFGVGCDQLLVVAEPKADGAHIAMKIFNADGTSAKQCGNGVRCFAKFVRERGLVDADPIRVETAGGLVEASFLDDGQIRVNMGVPKFDPGAIPMLAGPRAKRYALRLDGEEFTIGAVSMGNPHAVLLVDDAESAPVGLLGPKVQAHQWFPEGVNVGFLQVLSNGHGRLRVFERGVGETLACGSGACAALAVGVDQGVLGSSVRMDLNGGSLKLEWAGDGEPIWMTGPAADVFEGEIDI